MDKKGQNIIFIFLIIVAIVVLFFTVGMTFSISSLSHQIDLTFPRSASFISKISNNTYLMNEKIFIGVDIRENSTLETLWINDLPQNISSLPILFQLDTMITNGDSKQTKILSIAGELTNKYKEKENFNFTASYEIISSTEEFILKNYEDTKNIANASNIIAFVSGFLALFSLIISILSFRKNKS